MSKPYNTYPAVCICCEFGHLNANMLLLNFPSSLAAEAWVCHGLCPAIQSLIQGNWWPLGDSGSQTKFLAWQGLSRLVSTWWAPSITLGLTRELPVGPRKSAQASCCCLR